MKKTMLIFGASALAFETAFAVTDEFGLEPNQWFRFNGSSENLGSAPMKLESAGFKYSPSRTDLAGYDSMPYTGSGPSFGSGAWTVLECVKFSQTVGDLSWAFGKKDSSNGLALASGGAGKVALCTWTQDTTTKLLEVEVVDSTTKYHTYAVVVDPAAKTATLYVDGAPAGAPVTIGGNPSGQFQFGGIYGGEPEDAGLVKNGNCYHDEWRFYQQALTIDQIRAFAANFPAWGPWKEITTDTTFDATAEAWTGSGDVVINAKVYLTYDLAEHNMLKDFTGRIILGSNATLYSRQSKWDETNGPFGQATIEFAGGTLEGFDQRNNVKLTNPIVVRAGTESKFNSWKSASGPGCNTELAGQLSGSGKLTVRDEFRWVHLTGDCSAFAGELVVHLKGDWTSGTIETVAAGSSRAKYVWETEGQKKVSFAHPVGTTLTLGDLIIEAASSLELTNEAVVEVGARGGESRINVPVTNKKLQFVKVGAGVLRLGPSLMTLAGSTVAATAGRVIVEGELPNVTVTVSESGAVEGDADAGRVSVNVVYAEGSGVVIPVAEGTPISKSLSYPILTVSSGYTGTGSPSVLNAKGRWKTVWIANADGSHTLTAVNRDGMIVVFK